MNKIAQKYKNQERQSLSDQKDQLFKYKKEWNSLSKNFLSQMKEFNSELIEFKKIFNGRAEGGEKIKLYQPLPESASSKLNQLTESIDQKAALFSQIADQASRIINYQNDYSKKYNSFYSSLEEKRKANLAKPAYYQDYNLVSEGISPMGITWESVKSFFGDKKDSMRVGLLRQFFNIDQKISNLQKEILDARSYQDVAKVKAKLMFLGAALRSIYHTLNLLSSNQKKEEAGLDGLESQPKEEVGLAGKSQPGDDGDVDLSPSNSSKARIRGTRATQPGSTFEVPKPTSDIEKNKKIFDLIKNDFTNIDFAYSWISKSDGEKIGSHDILRLKLKLWESLQNAHERKYDDLRTDKLIETYNEVVRKLFLKEMISTEDFNVFENFTQKIRRNAYYNYNQIIKYANDNPYDPTLMKLKKMISKFGLKFKVFFEIKGNLEELNKGCDQVRQSLSFIIKSLEQPNVNYQEISQEVKNTYDNMNNLIDFAGSTQGIIKNDFSEGDMASISKIEDAVGKSQIRSLFNRIFAGKNERVKAKR
jgi:hypothetical protein